MQVNAPPEPVDGVRRIVLTGFMGSGKSTVGRLLASRLGWRFADLDDSIEELLGRPVPQIFAEQGEAAFRAAELDALRELLAGSRVVIALGGGAPETPGLRDLLAGAPETEVVHLDAPFDALYGRCTRQALDPASIARPLLGSPEEARSRFIRRQPCYESIRTRTVSASPGQPEDIADAVLGALRGLLPLP